MALTASDAKVYTDRLIGGKLDSYNAAPSNPIALRTAKTLWSLDRSECNLINSRHNKKK